MAEAFAGRKQGAEIPDGQPVCRVIMEVRACSELMLSLGGDIDDTAVPSQFLSFLMQRGEVLLVSDEDLERGATCAALERCPFEPPPRTPPGGIVNVIVESCEAGPAASLRRHMYTGLCCDRCGVGH